jgi:hypothetical protein
MSLTPFRINNKILLNLTQNSSGVNSSNGSLIVQGGVNILQDLYVGGAVQSSSDIRLKENIIDFQHSLDKIDNLRTIRFNYLSNQETQIGFIANDFVQDFPELLKTSDTGYYSMDYSKVTPILLDCIKDLKKRIIALEAKVL